MFALLFIRFITTNQCSQCLVIVPIARGNLTPSHTVQLSRQSINSIMANSSYRHRLRPPHTRGIISSHCPRTLNAHLPTTHRPHPLQSLITREICHRRHRHSCPRNRLSSTAPAHCVNNTHCASTDHQLRTAGRSVTRQTIISQRNQRMRHACTRTHKTGSRILNIDRS